jgi:serine protease
MKRTFIIAAAFALLAVPAALAAKPAPKNITIGPNNATVKFGGSVTLTGKLNGSNNANRPLTIEADPSPFEGNFSNVGSTTTNATGDWTFSNKPERNTRYRARSGNAESKAVEVSVRPAISLSLSDSTPAVTQRERFFGQLCPEHDGVSVALQRRFGTQWRTVRSMVLKDIPDSTCSSYSKQLRVRHDSRWRVHFNGDANFVAGNSRSRLVNVHR